MVPIWCEHLRAHLEMNDQGGSPHTWLSLGFIQGRIFLFTMVSGVQLKSSTPTFFMLTTFMFRVSLPLDFWGKKMRSKLLRFCLLMTYHKKYGVYALLEFLNLNGMNALQDGSRTHIFTTVIHHRVS